MLTPRERRIWIVAGLGVLAALALFIGLAVHGLLGVAVGLDPSRSASFDAYIWRVLRFTLWQAALSTLLSVAGAVIVARALARRPDFAGRVWVLRLFAVPLGLPAIVAALGLIEIWGRQGVVNAALAQAGMAEPISVYGLAGILIAHVFFNLPLAARLLLGAVERVPGEYWRNAAHLGLGQATVFRLVEWPAMRRVLPGIAGLVFMLCVTSFTLVLLLGGGPAATTIEVAIYQALRFDFDPPRAVYLALMQIILTAMVLAALAFMRRPDDVGTTGGGRARRHDVSGRAGQLGDAGVITVAALFVCAPLAAVVAAGASADFVRLAGENAVRRAFITSFAVAGASSALCLLMAVCVVMARHALGSARPLRRLMRSMLAASASLVLLVPPAVLGAGWFVLLIGRGDVFSAAPVIVVAVNALMALPFVMRVLDPAFQVHAARTGRLSAALGLTGWRRLWLIDGPALRPSLIAAFAFAMALSLGDLGVIALFGSQDVATLPYLLLQRMGSYRTDDAAGLALVLGAMCLLFMALGTRRHGAGA